jgi:hypothetical protein
MEDINSKIDRLNKYKNINFFIFGITILFLLSVAIWAAPQADTPGEEVLLAYLIFHLILSSYLLFFKVKAVKMSPSDQPLDFYQTQIDRTITSNDLAPFFFFIPILFGMVSIWAIDISLDKSPTHWIYIAFALLWIICLYNWFKMRKFIRLEYREIHGVDFLSFFHF